MYSFKDWKKKWKWEKGGREGENKKEREGRIITYQKFQEKANLYNKAMKSTKMWHKYNQFLECKARGSNEPWNGIEILVLRL